MATAPAVDRKGLLGLALIMLCAWGLSTGWRHYVEQGQGERVAAAARPGDIHMLASTTCAICHQARAWFTQRGVPFSECLIERDAACAARFQELGGVGTPTFVVRGQRVIGFDRERIAQALETGSGPTPVR
jgi:glutaredoxin